LTNQARKILQDIKIPFVSFYSAVEFHDHVPQATRERLESALKEMGILDALILPEQVAGKTSEQEQAWQDLPVHDRVLKPAPQILAHTLADYLYPLHPRRLSAFALGSAPKSSALETTRQSLLS